MQANPSLKRRQRHATKLGSVVRGTFSPARAWRPAAVTRLALTLGRTIPTTMDLRYDWKFFLTLAITIASVAVPVWLWQIDLSSKALSLTVKSTAELQPIGIDSLDGIQLSMDGKALESPYVSVLEFSNSGSRPIVTSDFEGPIRISTEGASKLVKVRTTSSNPPSLEPALSLAEGVVLLQPLLLNPGDTVRITAVAAGAKPAFTARARVVGVTEINVIDVQVGRETKRYWLGRAVSTLLLTLYLFNMTEFAITGLRRRIFLPRSLATGVIAGLGGAILVAIQSPENAAPTSGILPVMGIAATLSLPFVFRRIRRGATLPQARAERPRQTN